VEHSHRRAAAALDEVLEPLPAHLRERFEETVLEVLSALAPGDATPR
jgi:hypothetical protein